jgi:hypothetical protein
MESHVAVRDQIMHAAASEVDGDEVEPVAFHWDFEFRSF